MRGEPEHYEASFEDDIAEAQACERSVFSKELLALVVVLTIVVLRVAFGL